MKGKTDAIKIIATAKEILFQNIQTESDLKKYGLDKESYEIAKYVMDSGSIDADMGKPGEHRSLYFDPSDTIYKERLDKVAKFFETLGFNVTQICSEVDKDERGDGEMKQVGYQISSAYSHWDNSFFLYSDNVSSDLVGRTLRENYLDITRYPDDFTAEDKKAVKELLEQFGENAAAKRIECEYQLELNQNPDFINVYQIKKDYLDGYYKGDSYSDEHFDYEWYFEHPINPTLESLFEPDILVLSYTDKETGAMGGLSLSYEELDKMSQHDFESYVNECIFHDAVLQEQQYENEER